MTNSITIARDFQSGFMTEQLRNSPLEKREYHQYRAYAGWDAYEVVCDGFENLLILVNMGKRRVTCPSLDAATSF